jgi:hypothetical protein
MKKKARTHRTTLAFLRQLNPKYEVWGPIDRGDGYGIVGYVLEDDEGELTLCSGDNTQLRLYPYKPRR